MTANTERTLLGEGNFIMVRDYYDRLLDDIGRERIAQYDREESGGQCFDTEEIVSVLVNLGVGVHKIQGTSLDFTGKIGVNPSAAATFSYATSGGYSVGALASLRYTDKNMISIGDNRFRINFTNIRQEVFL